MPKIFKKLNESGVIHLIPLFVLLIGIVAGVYLVQHPQIFKPKASAPNVQFLPGSCVENGALKCPNVQIKFTSPLDSGGQTFNRLSVPNLADIRLVKVAYAAEFISGGFCQDDKSKIYSNISSEGIGVSTSIAGDCSEGTTCKSISSPEGALCVDSEDKPVVEGKDWKCEGNKIHQDSLWPWWLGGGFLATNITCPDNTECKQNGNKVTCAPPEQKPTTSGKGLGPDSQDSRLLCYSQQKANKNGDKTKDCFVCQSNTIIRGVRPDGSQYTQSECPTGSSCQLIDPGNLISDASCTSKSVTKTVAPVADGPIGGNKCTTSCVYSQQDSDGVHCYSGNNDSNNHCVYVAGCTQKVPCPGGAGAPSQGGTSTTTTPKEGLTIDKPCQDNPPVGAGIGARPEGYSWIADCSHACTQNGDCPQETGSGYINPKDSNWCYGFRSGARCLKLRYDGKVGGQSSCTKGEAGNITSTQANCVLNLRDDVLKQYARDGWCTDDSNKQAVVNNWMFKLANQKDKDSVSSCFTAGTPGGSGATITGWVGPDSCSDGKFSGCSMTGGKVCTDYGLQTYQGWSKSLYDKCQTICTSSDRDTAAACPKKAAPARTTTRFRFAEDSILLKDWIDYTAGGTTVPYVFKDPTPDGKARFIYAEFEIVTKDSDGNITKTETVQADRYPTQIIFAKAVASDQGGNGNIPAGSDCSAYETTSVCGGGFTTYNKCTDDKGQTGDNLCSGIATTFYCVGSTNSSCDSRAVKQSDNTYKIIEGTFQYSCAACPNLKSKASGGGTGGPLTANCSVSGSTTVPVNQPVTYNASAIGGSGSYKYYWAGDLGNTSSTNSELVKTYTTTGYKTGSVIVSSGNDSRNSACPAVNVVGEESPELLCKQDCKKCKIDTTCGYKTYDNCVDDKGNSKGSSSFCQNGAQKFRCYANANYNCASNQPNVYDYLCSACNNTGSSGE